MPLFQQPANQPPINGARRVDGLGGSPDNIAALGAAALLNKIQLRVTRAMPNSHEVAVFVTNMMQALAGDPYGPYFRAISHSYQQGPRYIKRNSLS